MNDKNKQEPPRGLSGMWRTLLERSGYVWNAQEGNLQYAAPGGGLLFRVIGDPDKVRIRVTDKGKAYDCQGDNMSELVDNELEWQFEYGYEELSTKICMELLRVLEELDKMKGEMNNED